VAAGFSKSLTLSMLVHFHRVEYKECYEELFKGLAVNGNVKACKVTLGRYFVLSLDFASLNRSSNMMVAESMLNDMMILCPLLGTTKVDL